MQNPQILVGGGDDADIGLDRRAAADRRVFALLQHAQQTGLRLHRHVADLVEEQRAALGLFEAAGGALVGAGEGPLLVAEQFALDEVARNGRHVDGDEGAFLALAVIVQRAGHQFLAGAGLAVDHHGEVGLHQARERAIDFLHRRRAPDERHALDLLGRAGVAVLARLGHRAADDADQLLEVEGLRQIVIGAALRRADRGHEGVLRAHDDDRQLGPQFLDAGQQFEGVFVRHHHVGDDEIALARLHPAPKRRRRAGGANLISRARQRLRHDRADRGVVVGDEYFATVHEHCPQPQPEVRRENADSACSLNANNANGA